MELAPDRAFQNTVAPNQKISREKFSTTSRVFFTFRNMERMETREAARLNARAP